MKQIPLGKVILPPDASPAGIEADRCRLIELAENDRASALSYFHALSESMETTEESRLSAASVYQIGAWLQVGDAAYNAAIGSVVKSLSLLVEIRNPEKQEKVEMKAMAAALLYDYAVACRAINSSMKAEKSLANSAKLYNSLASKTGEARFFEPAAIVASASTKVYKSRLKQLNALAHHQAATEYYEGAIRSGEKNAMAELVASIAKEAEILLSVGRFRTAVRYFTKAVRYQRKLSGKFDAKELRLSLKLAEALLYVPLRREAGLKLISALRKSAETMGMQKELEQIRQLEEREKLIHFNLITFLKNLII